MVRTIIPVKLLGHIYSCIISTSEWIAESGKISFRVEEKTTGNYPSCLIIIKSIIK